MPRWRRILGDRQTLDAHLDLLDRQLVDRDGRMAGKVDDLELSEDDSGRLTVTAVLTGPGALGPRLGGAVGAITTATWSRLSGRRPDRPSRIGQQLIDEVGTAIRLSADRAELEGGGFETWARTRVVEALPGAGGAARIDGTELTDDGESGDPADERGSTPERAVVPPRARRLSDVLGMRVVGGGSGDGSGLVLDLVLAPDGDDRLAVTAVVVGRRRPGTLFGYHRHPDQGPWLIRTVVLALHRGTRVVPWPTGARVSWDEGVVELGNGAGNGA